MLDGAAPPVAEVPGTVTERDVLAEYAAYLNDLVDLRDIRPLHVVVDAGNGMAGYTVPAVLGDLPLRIEPLYFELDGNFPNHEANPLEPANLVDLQAEVDPHRRRPRPGLRRRCRPLLRHRRARRGGLTECHHRPGRHP